MRNRKTILLASAVLIFGVALAQFTSRPAPPLCRVEVAAQPDRVPNFYRVSVRLRPECPADSVADVRLESYVGGRFPRVGWFRVTRTAPLTRSGIPWYWRVGWRSASGQVYSLPLPVQEQP